MHSPEVELDANFFGEFVNRIVVFVALEQVFAPNSHWCSEGWETAKVEVRGEVKFTGRLTTGKSEPLGVDVVSEE